MSDEWFEDEEYIEEVEEEVIEEEYITSENDPKAVLIVPEDDYVIYDNEVKAESDEVVGCVNVKSTPESLLKHDMNMNLKVLQALRDGTLR